MDQCNDMSQSYFLNCNSDLATTMINFIKDLRAKHGKNKATIMCYDNVGTKNHLKSYLRRKDWVKN